MEPTTTRRAEPLRDFLEIPYDQLEEMNLEAKEARLKRVSPGKIREERVKYLTDEKRIKAVTVCFTDLEGRLHMLDYDKKFLLKSADNLTFDGSSIRGFSQQAESDLRLAIDWPAFYWLPSDVFGPGKVLVFGEVLERDGTPYRADMRGRLKSLHRGAVRRRTARSATPPTRSRASSSRAATPSAATTRPASSSSSHRRLLPLAAGRPAAQLHRHGRRGAARDGLREREGPPRGRAVAVRDELLATPRRSIAADQVQLYKLLCRQVAAQHGHDRQLPAQAGDRRQRQRHAHQHVAQPQAARTCSTTRRARTGCRSSGWELHRPHPDQRARHLPGAQLERQRLPPARPALRGAEPDQGLGDRPRRDGAHPARQRASRRASRCARSRPDANPYMAIYTLLRTGLEGPADRDEDDAQARAHALPARQHLRRDPRSSRAASSRAELLGEDVHAQVRRAEAGLGRALPEGAGHADQDAPRSSSTTR